LSWTRLSYLPLKITQPQNQGMVTLSPSLLCILSTSSFLKRINAIKAAFLLTITLSIGWFLYLGFHITGRKYPKWVSHFNPWSPLFSPREVPLVLISDVGILATVSLLAYLSYQYSFLWVVMVYGIPYLHCNFWYSALIRLHSLSLQPL